VPQTSLVALENTHNSAGGKVLPLETARAIRDVTREMGLPLHLDGARLWHACAATGHSLADYGEVADTVMVCLSKGLGAPVGSLLAGDEEVMERAWRVRRRLGGGMRQSGILAAAGLYALEHNRERLMEDHRRARELAQGIQAIAGLRAGTPDTNIVMIDLEAPELTPDSLLGRLAGMGVLMVPFGPRRLRAVAHLDVDDEGIRRAVSALGTAVEDTLA
jgi:threonine aldolase